MFAGYNKFDEAKVRIGSWREELALKELTGVTRLANPRNKAVFNATDVRLGVLQKQPETPQILPNLFRVFANRQYLAQVALYLL